MLRLILIMAAMVWCWDNPFRLVYTNDGELCRFQDSLIQLYPGTIDKRTIRTLKINYWVRTAEKLAPGNLIIRQYCLIDLFEDKPCHKAKIRKLVNTISGGPGKYRTWAESYTYFLYTQMMLDPWVKRFSDDSVKSMIREIKMGFAYTAYERSTFLRYPAPFGDLWEVPLDSETSVMASSMCDPDNDVEVKNIKRYKKDGLVTYNIAPMPMGLNGHCEKQRHEWVIRAGIPDGFKFYDGYDKKYKNQKAEWTDLLDPRRLFTIPFIW